MTSAFKHIAFYGLSIALMKGLSLLMLPFISHHLSPEEMGLLELVTTFAIFMSLFVAAGLEDCLFRFSSNLSALERDRVIASLYGWALILGAVFFGVVWHLAPLVVEITDLGIEQIQLRLVWAGVAFEGAITLPLAVMRMRAKAGLFLVIVLLRTFLQAGLTVWLLSRSPNVVSILLASLIATITQALILAIWQMKVTGVYPRRAQLSQIIRYGLPLLASGLCLFALNGIDKFFIAHWDTLATLGLYSVASKFALATVLLMQPFGMWWRPQRFSRVKQRPDFCAKILLLASALLSVVTLCVVFVGPLLINGLMPPAYKAAATMAMAISLILAMREAAEIFNLGILSRANTFLLFRINMLSALIGVILTALATLSFGVWGCIGALFISQTGRTVAIFVLSQQTVRLALPVPLLSFFIMIVALGFGASSAISLYFLDAAAIIFSVLALGLGAFLIFGAWSLAASPRAGVGSGLRGRWQLFRQSVMG